MGGMIPVGSLFLFFLSGWYLFVGDLKGHQEENRSRPIWRGPESKKPRRFTRSVNTVRQ